MSEFNLMYLCFTGYLVASGLTMIATYSFSYPWWRYGLGRIVIIYASAEIAMSAILCLAVVWHISPVWFRGVWFGLQAVVGTTFCVQTAEIVRLRRRRRQRERQGLHPETDA